MLAVLIARHARDLCWWACVQFSKGISVYMPMAAPYGCTGTAARRELGHPARGPPKAVFRQHSDTSASAPCQGRISTWLRQPVPRPAAATAIPTDQASARSEGAAAAAAAAPAAAGASAGIAGNRARGAVGAVGRL